MNFVLIIKTCFSVYSSRYNITVQSNPIDLHKILINNPPSCTTEFNILKLQNKRNKKNKNKIVKGKMPSHRMRLPPKGMRGPPKELVLNDIAEARGNIRETLVIRKQAP